jgi:protein PsiE
LSRGRRWSADSNGTIEAWIGIRITRLMQQRMRSAKRPAFFPTDCSATLGERLQMPDVQSGLIRTSANLHRRMKATADAVGILLVDGFHYLALFAIGATTVWSAVAAFIGMLDKGHAELSDILLLFIYLEIGATVGIYFKTTRLPVRYLIYIAMTALGRILIEVGGAEHKTGKDLLIVSGAIFVLSFAVLVLRFASNKGDPSDTPNLGSHLEATHAPDTTEHEPPDDDPILRK